MIAPLVPRSSPVRNKHKKTAPEGAVFFLYLQMQNPILDLLGSALIPVLGADVAAGTSGHVHLSLIGVAALWAGPDQLAIVLADLISPSKPQTWQ